MLAKTIWATCFLKTVQGKKNVFAAAAAKPLQSCPTLCNPIDGSPQAPLSPGFPRQEHWSGLPFPSMHESEKWKWSCSVVSNSSRPHGLQPTRLLCPWDFPSKSTGVGCHCLLQMFLKFPQINLSEPELQKNWHHFIIFAFKYHSFIVPGF